MSKSRKSHLQWLRNISLAAYVLFMLWQLYLGRYRSFGYAGYNFTPFKTIRGYLMNFELDSWILLVNLVGNIVVFIPMGFFIALLLKRANIAKILMISIVILVPVEVMQYVLSVGSFDVDDILLNTLGSILGYGIYKAFHMFF